MEESSQRVGRPSLARDITAVRRNMSFRFAYMRLYHAAARGMVERDAQPLMREFADEEREVLAKLSAALRQMRQPVPVEQPDDSLARKMSARRGTINRLRFVRQGLVTALDWYFRHAEDEGHHPDVRALFKELGDAQLQRVRRLDDLVKKLKREKGEPAPSNVVDVDEDEDKDDDADEEDEDDEERGEPGEETPVGQ